MLSKEIFTIESSKDWNTQLVRRMAYTTHTSNLQIGSEINEKLRKLTATLCKLVDTLNVESVSRKYDREIREVCVDGKTWTQILSFDIESSSSFPLEIIWLDENLLPVAAPSSNLINNANCQIVQDVCIPQEQYFNLANIPTEFIEFTNLALIKPECCKIQYSTSVSITDIVIPKGVVNYISSDFKCPIILNSITPDEDSTCNLEDIHVYLTRTK